MNIYADLYYHLHTEHLYRTLSVSGLIENKNAYRVVWPCMKQIDAKLKWSIEKDITASKLQSNLILKASS